MCWAPATAFMSGFLRGWLKGETHATARTWANACGAFAVSRLLCSPEIPTFGTSCSIFLKHGSKHRALRKDEAINHIHWATTRRPQSDTLFAFAIDHRRQLEDDGRQARRAARADRRLQAAGGRRRRPRSPGGKPGFGMLLDDTYGREAMFDAAKHGLWIARPLEEPGSRPLRFEFTQDVGSRLVEWPVGHTIKCLAFYHPDDDAALKDEQAQKLRTLFEAARGVGRELMIEIIAGKHGPLVRTPSRGRSTNFMRAASSPTGGSSSRRRPPRPGRTSAPSSTGTIPIAAASCFWGSKRRKLNLPERLRRGGRPDDGEGICHRPHDLQ